MQTTRPALLALSAFILLGDLRLLGALLSAALCHEMAHYAVLRLFGRAIKEINFTVLGAEMKADGGMGYGGEWLATAAGPVTNLLLAVLLAAMGRSSEFWYLFSGAQAVLGLFNLLPIRPLDGGNLLWITVAVLTEPFTADKVCRWVGFSFAVSLTALCLWLLLAGGGGFPLIAAMGLLIKSGRELGLVKWKRTR